MKHDFKYDEAAECSVCRKCGYVRGEDPYQKCPMKLDGRNK